MQNICRFRDISMSRDCDVISRYSIEDFVRPLVEELENVDNVIFMQDGATCHTCMQSMAVLREMFPGKLISLRETLDGPLGPPTLTRVTSGCGVP